jgi:hypothetical protein
MKFSIASTRLTFVTIASMILSLSMSNPADANDIKIGVVKHDLPSGLCFAYLPGTKKEMLVIPFTNKKSEKVTARMNINGENIRLRQTSHKLVGKTSFATYQSKNVIVTIESKMVLEREEPVYYSNSVEKISIKSKGITKNINTKGGCNG